MSRSDTDGDDIFFDACDDIRTSAEPSSSDHCSTSGEVSAPRKLEYELWAGEPTSIQERRHRFLKEMGLHEFMPTRTTCSWDQAESAADSSFKALEERVSTSSSASLDSSSENEMADDSACCIRDLDSGKRFIVRDAEQNGLSSMLKEVGSDNMMTLEEFESLLGLSRSVQKFLRREHGPVGEKSGRFGANKKDSKSWWKKFVKKKSAAAACKYDVHVKNSSTNRSFRTRVKQQSKKCMEFSALYTGQEFQAHKGLIRVMKFSPSGWYLASGGEDCVVRIWQIREVEASSKSYGGEVSHEYIDETKGRRLTIGKSHSRALAIIPKKAFSILETPLHEFHGHTSDILDISWSKSDYLLTSSKDKTVRMWRVGCDSCLAIFKHKDYVTSVQFNPVDERYFISGSIDSKVRVWRVSENRVVDWADARDIITALSYQSDGQGFVVGTITGTCRFYNHSGEDMQLDKQLHIQRKRKSAANQITGLQFCTDASRRLMITSTDSKVRVAKGDDIIQKFRGPRKAKALLSPSFTSDGRYAMSVGLDSHVYIWNFDVPLCHSYKGEAKSVHSCELFYSEGVSVAVPWPGVHRGWQCLSSNHLQSSSLPLKILDPSTLLRDPDCCSLGTWFFSDGLIRGLATWPEEKLLSSMSRPSHETANRSQIYNCLATVACAWNMVIVTASHDGVIRSFHNYGLPVRL